MMRQPRLIILNTPPPETETLSPNAMLATLARIAAARLCAERPLSVEDLIDRFEERAALLEHDAGHPRASAEEAALTELLDPP